MSMNKNGVSTTNAVGMEQFEEFENKVGGKRRRYFQYDYRHQDGELFSCVKRSLEDCRAARDEWIRSRETKFSALMAERCGGCGETHCDVCAADVGEEVSK